MTVSSDSPDALTMSRYSRCSALRSVSSASSVMPMTPFIGVRISWLILARNSLFARLAASAALSARFLSTISAWSAWWVRSSGPVITRRMVDVDEQAATTSVAPNITSTSQRARVRIAPEHVNCWLEIGRGTAVQFFQRSIQRFRFRQPVPASSPAGPSSSHSDWQGSRGRSPGSRGETARPCQPVRWPLRPGRRQSASIAARASQARDRRRSPSTAPRFRALTILDDHRRP